MSMLSVVAFALQPTQRSDGDFGSAGVGVSSGGDSAPSVARNHVVMFTNIRKVPPSPALPRAQTTAAPG